jgi:hypothetical protein
MDEIAASNDLLLMSDKIFSVLAILLVIFGSLAGYLFFLNKKIGALEEKIDALEKE